MVAFVCLTLWSPFYSSSFFFFNDTATTEIYTLSLHDALPIFSQSRVDAARIPSCRWNSVEPGRSEEHTSELQSRLHLVCRLLLDKKNNNTTLLCANYHPLRVRHQRRLRTYA